MGGAPGHLLHTPGAKPEARGSFSPWRAPPAPAPLSPAQATTARWKRHRGPHGLTPGPGSRGGWGHPPSWGLSELTTVSQPLPSPCRTLLRPGRRGDLGGRPVSRSSVYPHRAPRDTVSHSEVLSSSVQGWLGASPERSQPQRGQACGSRTLSPQLRGHGWQGQAPGVWGLTSPRPGRWPCCASSSWPPGATASPRCSEAGAVAPPPPGTPG